MSKLTHEEMKSVLSNGRQKGKEYETTCPVCGHGHLRLFGEDGVRCMNDCSTPDVVTWMKAHIKGEKTVTPAHAVVKATPREKPITIRRPGIGGITVAEYCRAKGFNETDLQVLFGSDIKAVGESTRAGLSLMLNGTPVIQWPYMDSERKTLATKIRKSASSHDTHFKPHDPHIPYGLWLFGDIFGPHKAEPIFKDQTAERMIAENPNYYGWPSDIVLTEGESDLQTLAFYAVPSLGISGSQGWRTEFKDLPPIKNAKRVFVAMDSDADGQKFADKIAKDVQIYRLVFPTKDVNELHTTAPMNPAVTDPRQRKDAFYAIFEGIVQDALKNEPEEMQKSFSFSDTGNAERLVHMHGSNFRYLTDEKVFCYWNGEIWEKDKSGDVLLPVTKSVARSITDTKWQLTSESRGARKNMIELSKGESSVLVKRDMFDTNTMLLNVRNGTIDLETQELRPFIREDYLTQQAPVEHNDFATCPKFEAFLNRIFSGNQELIHFVVKALGYSLTGSAVEQCFFLCHGTGANGKSTLFEIFRGLLGADYTSSAGFSTFVERKHQDASGYDIARLPGRRMVTTSEPSKSAQLNEELLKQLTGNEVVSTRQIYGVPFDFKPTCKLWFAMNQDPKIVGTDEGIWRRVRYIPFAVQIPKEDQIADLQRQLIQEEGSGILNLLLRGVRDWLAEDLIAPDAVQKATNAFRSSQDILSVYFDERTAKGKNLHVKAGALYEDYMHWAESRNEFVQSQNAFFGEVVGRGYERRRVHGEGAHYYGLELRSTPSQPNIPF